MTEVVFHLNVPEIESYACRLLRKAYLKGAAVAVQVREPLATALDQRLWTMTQGEFVPHAGLGAGPRVVKRSPIVLVTSAAEETDARILVNLTTEIPVQPGRFDRVIELVGQSESEIAQARVRWKTYRTSGLEPKAHDLASREPGG